MINTDVLIVWGAAYKKLQPGEVIFWEGSQAHFYHQLESGSIKWLNIDDEGNEFIHHIIEPGECFGEMPVFDKEPYVASAIAERDSVILRLHESSFHQLMRENPEILLSFTREMAHRLRHKFLITNEMTSHNPEHQITALIGHFKKNNHHICPDCNRSEEHTSELQSLRHLVCRLLLEKK